MKYMTLAGREREALLAELAALPDFLESVFGHLEPAEARVRGPDDAFSPVEHCWHLADLEREGFAVRIRRLREEVEPELADFDGAAMARERDYRSLELRDGLAALRAARLANLEVLRELTAAEWSRSGTQEGVGRVSLCDVPGMMASHDAEHREQISAWLRGG